jgi:hypothetical protein
MKRLFCLFAAVPIATVLVCAQGQDQQYLRIYSLIQDADRLNASGSSASARTKYIEADTALKLRAHPSGMNIVSFALLHREKVGLIPGHAEPSAMPEDKAGGRP